MSVHCADGHGSNHCIREYSWNGISYDEDLMNAPTQMIKTDIGDGRNDGTTRVYGAGRTGHVHEYTYNDGEWDMIDIHPEAEYLSRYGLVVDNPNMDGLNHLYSVAQFGDFREHSWQEEQWNEIALDTVTGATANLNVGRGRNDYKKRVYVAGVNGTVYEYSHINEEEPATITGSISSDDPEADLSQALISIQMKTETTLSQFQRDSMKSLLIFPLIQLELKLLNSIPVIMLL